MKTKRLIAQTAGNKTSDIFYPDGYDTVEGILHMEVFFFSPGTSNVITILLEGRMTPTDLWATVATYTEADTGTTVNTNLAIEKKIPMLPEMRVTITTDALTFHITSIMEY